MSKLTSISEYLINNDITEQNITFIMRQISDYGSEEYAKGYADRCAHAKRLRRIQEKRRSIGIKKFLDWISDKAHRTEAKPA